MPKTRGSCRPGELQERGWRPSRGKRRGSKGGNMSRCNGVQGIRQGREFFEVNGQRWGRSRDRSTQWAIHTGRCFEFPVIPSHVHHFHAAPGRTNHLHAARLDDCGGNGRTQEKRKPHQHQFGDEFGSAQGMHSYILPRHHGDVGCATRRLTKFDNKLLYSSTCKLLILLHPNRGSCGLCVVTVRKKR